MKEDKQMTILIAVGLFFCMLILGYAAFFASPIELYYVTNVSVSSSDSMPFSESLEESSSPDLLSSQQKPESVIININTATLLELMELKGIGETTAERIIQYREENGAFSDIHELLNVKGIGEKKFESIEPYVKIDE